MLKVDLHFLKKVIAEHLLKSNKMFADICVSSTWIMDFSREF